MRYVIILLCVLFLVSGCTVDYTVGKSSTRLAQETLLKELEYCDHKFDSDNVKRKELNNNYCMEVLDVVESLIRDGYFEIDKETEVIISNVTQPKSIPEFDYAVKELEKVKDGIIGDI